MKATGTIVFGVHPDPRAVAPPALAAGEVHAWRLDLSRGCPLEEDPALHADDWYRANRFAFERDRKRFLLARRALRCVLAGYLGLPARRVPITFGHHGKPLLAGAHGLGFNLSHSGDLGLLAVCRAAHVGADVEEVVPRGTVRELARSVCSAEEQQSLDDVDETGLLAAFLTCWTRKEAVLKALGTGLVLEPSRVNVGILTARGRVAIGGEPGDGFVVVESITCDDQFIGAVAVAGGMSVTRVLELNALGASA